MIIHITVECTSGEKSSHLRRYLYKMLEVLGFRIHVNLQQIHNGEVTMLHQYDGQSYNRFWTSLTAINDPKSYANPNLCDHQDPFEKAVDEFFLPKLTK